MPKAEPSCPVSLAAVAWGGMCKTIGQQNVGESTCPVYCPNADDLDRFTKVVDLERFDLWLKSILMNPSYAARKSNLMQA
jgi:hypothetical protein